jgi:hypothetical protein
MSAQDGPPAPGVMAPGPELLHVQAELLRGIERAVSDFLTQNSQTPMEASAKSALDFAQAYVILNPSLDSTGIPLEHEVGMTKMNHDHEAEMEKLKNIHAKQQAAAAPTPAKGAKP